MDYEVGDYVECSVPHDYKYVDVDAACVIAVPGFATHRGEILRVITQPDGSKLYEVWGPGGEQYRTVGPECLKLLKAGPRSQTRKENMP